MKSRTGITFYPYYVLYLDILLCTEALKRQAAACLILSGYVEPVAAVYADFFAHFVVAEPLPIFRGKTSRATTAKVSMQSTSLPYYKQYTCSIVILQHVRLNDGYPGH